MRLTSSRWLLLVCLGGLAAAGPAVADDATPPAPASQPSDPANPGKEAIIIDRVAAVVNDAVILQSEVAQRATPQLAELQRVTDGAERQRQLAGIVRTTLETMVDEELVYQAATEAKLDVDDEEVKKALDEVKQQNHVDDAQLAEALKQQGFSIDEYKKDVKRQIMRLRAINVLVRPRVNVTDAEVKAHYDKLAGQSATVTEVHLRHILVKMPDRPTPDDLSDARKRAGMLVERARGGEAFDKLALDSSDDIKTKAAGGDIGWWKKGAGLPTEWEEIVFNMAPGEIRGPVNGSNGLEIFQLVENKKESVQPFDQVKEELREKLTSSEMEKMTKSWLEELHKKAHVEIKI